MNFRISNLLTGTVLAFIALLFIFNVMNILFFTSKEPSTFISLDKIRGITLYYNSLPYTLNFEQQNNLIDLVNQAIMTEKDELKKLKPLPYNKIIVHPFNSKDIVIHLLGSIDENILFSVPDWAKDNYLMDTSLGNMINLLNSCHDLKKFE